MELSPASANLRYFSLTSTWGEESPGGGWWFRTNAPVAVSRAVAEAAMGGEGVRPVVQIVGIDTAPVSSWMGGPPVQAVDVSEGPIPPQFIYDGGVDTDLYEISAFMSYDGGGQNTPYDPSGGASRFIIELEGNGSPDFAAWVDAEATSDSATWQARVMVGHDGGQQVMILRPEAPFMETFLTGIKLWRVFGELPHDYIEPGEFWTHLLGAREIV